MISLMSVTDPPMEMRRLGHDGPHVSVLALGSWHTWDRARFEEAVELVRLAVDRGVNLFDVGVYRNREPDGVDSPTDVIFARVLQAAGIAREQYVMSIKIWLFPGENSAGRRRQLDEALFRFGTDHADGFVLGDILQADFDMERLVGDVGEMLSSGQVRWWGVNNWSARELLDACAAARRQGVDLPRVAQLRYSLARRAIAEGRPFEDALAATGVCIQASDTLEGGFLAGQPAPARIIAGDPGGLRRAIRDLAPRIAEIAAGFGASPAQLSLAFPLTNPRVASVLFGVRTLAQLRDNLGAVDLLAAHGDELRTAVEELWLDRGVVSPEASWGTVPDDDPNGYRVTHGEDVLD